MNIKYFSDFNWSGCSKIQQSGCQPIVQYPARYGFKTKVQHIPILLPLTFPMKWRSREWWYYSQSSILAFPVPINNGPGSGISPIHWMADKGWWISLRHISTERLLVPRDVAALLTTAYDETFTGRPHDTSVQKSYQWQWKCGCSLSHAQDENGQQRDLLNLDIANCN